MAVTVIREMFAGRKCLRILRTTWGPQTFSATKIALSQFPHVLSMPVQAGAAKISCRKLWVRAELEKFSAQISQITVQ